MIFLNVTPKGEKNAMKAEIKKIFKNMLNKSIENAYNKRKWSHGLQKQLNKTLTE